MNANEWKILPLYPDVHIRGRITQLCGRILCIDGMECMDQKHNHTAPYPDDETVRQKIIEFREHIRNLNEEYHAHTNMYRHTADANVVEMKLDAEFSDDKYATVLLPGSALNRVSKYEWGAKAIGSHRCAFTQNPKVEFPGPWLHAHLLPAEKVLSSFVFEDWLNCTLANMRVTDRLTNVKLLAGPSIDIKEFKKEKVLRKKDIGKTHPRGRFKFAYTKNGSRCYHTASISTKCCEQKAHDDALIKLERKCTECYDYMVKRNILLNEERWHAGEQIEDEVRKSGHTEEAATNMDDEMNVDNEMNSDYKMNADNEMGLTDAVYFLGSVLRGKIIRHCAWTWCFQSPPDVLYSHHGSKQDTQDAQLKFNRAHGSVNPYSIQLDEHTRTVICAPHEDGTRVRIIHDDDMFINEAIQAHTWKTIRNNPSDINSYAINANHTSPWDTPEKLVAFTKLKCTGKVSDEQEFKKKFSIIPFPPTARIRDITIIKWKQPKLTEEKKRKEIKQITRSVEYKNDTNWTKYVV